MTGFSEAEDKEEFIGNTQLLESQKNEYVYISGLEILQFKTDDKIIDYISLLGNNMIPNTLAVDKKIHISYHLITNVLKTIELNNELC